MDRGEAQPPSRHEQPLQVRSTNSTKRPTNYQLGLYHHRPHASSPFTGTARSSLSLRRTIPSNLYISGPNPDDPNADNAALALVKSLVIVQPICV